MQRAFLYGDLVFETMRWEQGGIVYFNLHLNRLTRAANLLGLEAEIDRDRVLQKIKILAAGFNLARVRIVLYRSGSGYYLPQSNAAQMELQLFPLENYSDSVETVGVYTQNYKSCTQLSTIKSGNALLYVLAAKYAQQQGWNDAIILNEHGRVCEATASNIVIQWDGRYITPPLGEGCVAGVMREACLQQLDNTFNQLEEQPITLQMLYDADSIWLTNALSGIRKVNMLLR